MVPGKKENRMLGLERRRSVERKDNRAGAIHKSAGMEEIPIAFLTKPKHIKEEDEEEQAGGEEEATSVEVVRSSLLWLPSACARFFCKLKCNLVLCIKKRAKEDRHRSGTVMMMMWHTRDSCQRRPDLSWSQRFISETRTKLFVHQEEGQDRHWSL